MRILKAILTALALAGASCVSSDDHDRDYDRAERTPYGLHVQFEDQGTLSTGLMTKAQVFSLFDQMFVEAGKVFETKNKVPVQSFLSAPHDHKIVFRLIDGWQFQSPTNGWIAGEAYGRETILLSWWNKRLFDPGHPPANPWTIGTDAAGVRHYGDRPGQIRDLIAHEMGHVFFGPQFGH